MVKVSWNMGVWCSSWHSDEERKIAMSVNVRNKFRKLNAAQRRKVKACAAEIMAEEMSLRDLRKARKLTQARVAKTLGITQDSVSRLEKRSDLLLSTLRKTVRAMGGAVLIIAEFPNLAPVVLAKLSGEGRPRKSSRNRANRRA
jgi:DNA-binding XRE family transcriptional regulator